MLQTENFNQISIRLYRITRPIYVYVFTEPWNTDQNNHDLDK